MKLMDYTKMLRSKNAGPLWLTMDLSFSDKSTMLKLLQSGILNAAAIAALYDVPEDQVKIIH